MKNFILANPLKNLIAKRKLLLSFMLFFVVCFSSSFATDYYWIGGAGSTSTNIGAAGTLSLTLGGASAGAITPAAADRIFFDGTDIDGTPGSLTGSTAINFTAAGTITIGQLIFQNTVNVTFSNSSTRTINVGGGLAGNDLNIQAGSTFTMGGTAAMTLALTTGNTSNIAGTLIIGQATSSQSSTFTIADAASNTVANGGTWVHAGQGGIATPLGNTIFSTGSTMIFRGSSTNNVANSITTRTFYNLSFESASGAWTPTMAGSGTLTVNGLFAIGGNGAGTVTVGAGYTGIATVAGLNIKGGCTYTPGANLVVNGAFTNNGIFNHNSKLVTIGTGGDIAGSAASSFYSLTINTASASDIVTLTKSGASVNFNSGGGTLTLNQGIFKIGSTNVFFLNGNGAIITNTANGNLATTGTNGADGGKIIFANTSGGSMNINGSGALTFYDLIAGGYTVGTANTSINQNNTNVLINDSLRWSDNNASWNTNSPKYSANATFYINNNGQSYTPGGAGKLQWAATSGFIIGTTAGYPNNVTLVNVGNPSTVSQSLAINGILSVGDGTIAGNITVSGGTAGAFSCGGIKIFASCTLTAPAANLTIKGSFVKTGGTFTHSSGTVTFGGSGTAASPQGITDNSLTSFFNIALTNGTYVKLNSPITLPATGALTLTSGKLETTTTNILSITNTAVTGITGTGSAINCITGPVKWTLNSGTLTYNFPVAAGTTSITYLPLTFNSKNSTGSNIATVQAFASNAGGSAGAGVSNLSTTEYWSLVTSSGLGTTGSTVTVTRPSGSGTNIIAKSNSVAGSYTSAGGTATGTTGTTGDILTTSPWLFVFATLPTPVIILANNPGGQVAAANVAVGTSDKQVFNFQLTGSASDVTLNTVNFTTAGTTATSSDITNFKLWYKATNDFSTAVQVGSTITATTGPNAHSFTGLTTLITNGSTGFFWITATIASGATSGNTVAVSAIATSDLAFSSPPTLSGSTTAGGTQTILALPLAVTSAATGISTTGATLNGTINANGSSTATYFNYGTTIGYGNTVTATPSTVTGTSATAVTVTIGSLIPNTIYNFRDSAHNANGDANGGNLSFTTFPNAPVIATATLVTANGFTANWTVPTGQGAATFTYTAEVDDDIAFGSLNGNQAGIASGTISFAFSGLSPLTTYYFRVKAVNTTGSSAYSVTSAAVITTFSVGTICTTGSGSSGTPGIIADGTPTSSTDLLWANAPANNITNTFNGSGAVGGSTWKAMFDAANLYVLVTIKDNTVAAGSANCGAGGNSYLYDGLDIYLDGANAKPGNLTNSSQNTYNRTCSGTNTSPTTGANTINTATYVPGTVTGGYTQFVKLPWANVAAMQNLSAGNITALSTIGFDVDYNDDQAANGTRAVTQAWFATNGANNYNNASTWGNAKLSVCAPPAVGIPGAASITSTSAVLSATVTALNGGGVLSTAKAGTVYRTTAGVTTENMQAGTTPVLNTSFSQSRSGLSPQTQYFFKGFATRTNFATNVTGLSSEGNFRTLSSPPTSPVTGLAAAPSSPTDLDLNWTDAAFPNTSATATQTGYLLIRNTGSLPTLVGLPNGLSPASAKASGTIVTTIAVNQLNGTVFPATTATATGLGSLDNQHFLIVPYTWDGVNASTYNYFTGSAATAGTTVVTACDSYDWNDIPFTSSGTYTLSFTNAAGGDSTATLILTINTSSTAAVISGDNVICSGSSTNLQVDIIDGASPYIVVYTDGTSNFTVNNYTSGDNISVVPAAASIYTLVSVTSADGCIGTGNSGSATVTFINPPAVITDAAPLGQTKFINSTPTNLTFTASGSSLTYQWYTNNSNSNTGGTSVGIGSGGQTTSYSPPTNILGTKYYYAVITGSCGSATTSAVAVTVTNTNTWAGGGTNNWSTGSNWTSGLAPTSVNDAVIPNGNTPYPALSASSGINDLTIDAGATVDINGFTLTITGAVTGTGTLSGSATSNLVTTATATVRFTPGANTLNNLNVNAGTTTLGNTVNITAGTASNTYGTVTVANGATLASNGNLNIKSNQFGTARVAAGSTGGNYITGDVTVERYIPANSSKAWRLLSVPTKGTKTIKQTWQENQAPGANGLPGFGTQITANLATLAIIQAAGFDAFSQSGSAMSYNSGTQAWAYLTSTNSAPIETNKGYFLYIRGSRAVSPSNSTAPVDATVLRTTGTLYMGDNNTAISVAAGKFEPFGNTYASAIDFTSLSKTGTLTNSIYVWDSKLVVGSQLGAYQTFVGALGFTPATNGGSYPSGVPNITIESGQAIMVGAPAGGGGTIKLVEAAKTTGNQLNPFRPAAQPAQFRTSLYKAGNTTVFADNNIVVFDNAYSNAADANDAVKIAHGGENLDIITDNKSLLVDARQPVTERDVIHYSLKNLQAQTYKLAFTTLNMNTAGLTAFVEDKYLHTTTEIDLNSASEYTFTVDANNAASAVSDRLRVVFKKAGLVPVSETKPAITVSPNPVEGSVAMVKFQNLKKGKYFVSLLSVEGKLLFTTVVEHAEGTGVYSLNFPQSIAAGIYQLEINSKDKTIQNIQKLYFNTK